MEACGGKHQRVVRVASLIAGFCLLVGLAVTIGLLENPAQAEMERTEELMVHPTSMPHVPSQRTLSGEGADVRFVDNETYMELCGPIRAIWYNNEKAATQRNLHITISLVTFLANSALAFVILSSDEFRKQRSNVFMVALGVSDMLYVLFFNLSQLNVNDLIGHTYTWCNYYNYVNAYFFCLPWFIFLGMNIDRLYAIRRPFAYVNAARLNKWKYSVPNIVFLCCLIAAIPPIPLIFDWVNKEGIAKDCDCMIPIQNKIWVWWQSFTSIIIPVFAILLIWMKIAHTVGLAAEQGQQVDSLLKGVTFKMIGITAFFLVCVIPFCLVFAGAGLFTLKSPKSFLNTFGVTQVNSLIQPFLYLGINEKLGKSLLEKLNCCQEKKLDNSTKPVSTLTFLP